MMVATIQIKPAPLLQPYVHCYAERTFNSETGLPCPQYAHHEYYLSFMLKKDTSCDLTDDCGKLKRKLSSSICTLYTQSQGCIYFKGSFVIFSVQFKANGLFAIFGIPQRILINTMLPVEDILGNESRLLIEQLESSENLVEMGKYMNAYLTGKLLTQKHKLYTTAIADTSRNILRNKGLSSVDALARYANMSLRNFERRFVDEVGVSPKLYMRIIRFYNTLENKMLHPQKEWTDITYEGGYFDQAHFIKECKEFSSKTPEEFFKYTPPPPESFIKET